MARFRYLCLSIFVLALAVVPAAAFAQGGPIEKTYCTYALGYESIERIKLDLLNNAKREAVNEFFGEFISAYTTVENSVVTTDQIRASSLGFVRVSGDAIYYNGSSFAEVCVLISAFVTQKDLALTDPVKVKKRVCQAREGMAADKLAEAVKEEAVAAALYDYDSQLNTLKREQVLRLMRKLTYHEEGFLAGTTTYCAEVEGEVTPIEVLAALAPVQEAAAAATSTAAGSGQGGTSTSTAGNKAVPTASSASTTKPIGEPVAIDPVESEHPYLNGKEQSWYINNNSGLSAMQLYFSRIEIEDGVDYIQITDPDGGLLQEIRESHPDGLWTEILPGVGVYVVLVTDNADNAWGFHVDAIAPVEYTSIARSAHPYPNNYDDFVVLYNTDANPEGTRVHFDRIELEDGVDYIVIEDAEGNPYQWITGSHPEGLISRSVSGSAVQVRLSTDRSISEWGYNIVKIETASADEAESRPTGSEILAETDHPHCKRCENLWSITNPDPLALSSKIHFVKLELPWSATVQILDANNTVIQTFQGDLVYEDLWSSTVPGRIVKVKFTNTDTSQKWGFQIDKIASSVANPGLAQTDHPHCKRCEQNWTITNPDATALSSKILIEWIELPWSATLQILDAKNTVIQTLSGAMDDGWFWSDYVPGRVVKLKFINTDTSQGWGFRVRDIATSVPNPGLAQTDHPHCKRCEQNWTITNPDPDATISRIHFDMLKLPWSATVQILDVHDSVVQTYKGTLSSTDFWSDPIRGRIVKLKFVNTDTSQDWGFRVDAIASE